jgi:hypothetical protein
VLAGGEREQRRGRVPVIGDDDRDGINRGVVKNAAEVCDGLDSTADAGPLSGETLGVDVANSGDLDAGQREQRLGMTASLVAGANDRNADSLVRTGGASVRRQPSRCGSGRGGSQKMAASGGSHARTRQEERAKSWSRRSPWREAARAEVHRSCDNVGGQRTGRPAPAFLPRENRMGGGSLEPSCSSIARSRNSLGGFGNRRRRGLHPRRRGIE